MMTRFAFALLAVACLAAAAAAQEIPDGRPQPETGLAPQVWQPVRVVTDEGWNLDNVALRWLADGSLVRVTRPDGSWKDHQPWTVRAVFAADGSDLTAAIRAARPGGERPSPIPPPPPRKYGEVGQVPPAGAGLSTAPAPAPPLAVAVTVGAGYAGFMGDWYTGFEASPSLQGCVRIGTGPRNWVSLGYRRQGGGSGTGYFYDPGIDDYRTLDYDIRVDEFLVMIGTRTNHLSPGRHVAYAELGLAVLNHVANASLSGYASQNDSETKLGAAVQFGGLIALDRNLVLDVGVDAVVKPGIFDDAEAGGTIFGAHVGIGWIDW